MVNILFSKYSIHEEWAKNEIKKYINKSDKVVVIPFAFCEKWVGNKEEWHSAYDRTNGKYYKEVVDQFLAFGVDEDNITWLNYFEDTEEEMKRIMKDSDIVFLTGGLPERAVERVLEKGLLEYMNNKVIIGASAGALMQLKNYSVSPDQDYSEFKYFKGLGLINNDFYVEVHYENSEIQNNCIKKVLSEKVDRVYAIKDNGGIVIDNGKFTLLGEVVTFNK